MANPDAYFELVELDEADPEAELIELDETDPGAGVDKLEESGDELKENEDELDDGPSMEAVRSITKPKQAQDPFYISSGPVTRSQTKRIKEAIVGLVCFKPNLDAIKDQDQTKVKMFNYSVFGLA